MESEVKANKQMIMKGTTTALFPAKNRIMNIYPFKGNNNNVATVTTKKQGKGVFGEEGTPRAKEKAEPIVAFSRPPPLPPLLGPLIALSLFENWLNRDGDDG